MVSLKSILYLLIFILVVHVIATVNYWYWTFRWFDIPMHFLGGFWLAMVFLWVVSKYFLQFPLKKTERITSQRGSASEPRSESGALYYGASGQDKSLSSKNGGLSGNEKLFALLIVLGFVALVGVLLEFSEFLFDVFLSKAGYAGSFQMMRYGVKDLYTDTLSDLFFDLIGGLVFTLLNFRRR